MNPCSKASLVSLQCGAMCGIIDTHANFMLSARPKAQTHLNAHIPHTQMRVCNCIELRTHVKSAA